jgi:shikimate dehydrogenase
VTLDDRRPSRLAVLGDPLTFTLSPVLHRAGLASLGVPCESRPFRTPVEFLGERLTALAEDGYRGASLTNPLKSAVIPYLARVSEAAARARSVNTVGFSADGWWGETTDGPGFVDLLRTLGRDPARASVVMLGGGGVARSLALALVSAGSSDVTASVREPDRVAPEWRALEPARVVGWRSEAERERIARASVIVNATPLGGRDGPLELVHVPPRALVIDLVYRERPTEWVMQARSLGLEAYDGLGLLVFQARIALALWATRPVAVEPLAAAVGWPR